jgi:hypothetical protein
MILSQTLALLNISFDAWCKNQHGMENMTISFDVSQYSYTNMLVA